MRRTLAAPRQPGRGGGKRGRRSAAAARRRRRGSGDVRQRRHRLQQRRGRARERGMRRSSEGLRRAPCNDGGSVGGTASGARWRRRTSSGDGATASATIGCSSGAGESESAACEDHQKACAERRANDGGSVGGKASGVRWRRRTSSGDGATAPAATVAWARPRWRGPSMVAAGEHAEDASYSRRATAARRRGRGDGLGRLKSSPRYQDVCPLGRGRRPTHPLFGDSRVRGGAAAVPADCGIRLRRGRPWSRLARSSEHGVVRNTPDHGVVVSSPAVAFWRKVRGCYGRRRCRRRVADSVSTQELGGMKTEPLARPRFARGGTRAQRASSMAAFKQLTRRVPATWRRHPHDRPPGNSERGRDCGRHSCRADGAFGLS